jgi:hypothetical protein
MIILNETISPDLIVFLAIFADIATIAIAYDNAPYQKQPVEWQLPKIWVVSVVLGAPSARPAFQYSALLLADVIKVRFLHLGLG